MNQLNGQNKRARTFSNILFLAGLFLLNYSVFSFLAILPLLWAYGVPVERDAILDFLNLDRLMNDPHGRYILLFIQTVISLGTFLLSAFLYLRFFKTDDETKLNPQPKIPIQAIVLTILLALAIMPITSLILEINQNVDFPDVLSSFEKWAFEKEKQLEELTLALTKFTHVGDLLIGLLVIAVIPAVGEELFFRGLLQRALGQVMNIHGAIWLTAITFSAIHLQFYGFLPRAVLGAVFGYLYFWSGNLWIPILAHFINNGFTLIMIYLYNTELSDMNISNGESAPWYFVLGAVIISSFIIYRFRQVYKSLGNEGSY